MKIAYFPSDLKAFFLSKSMLINQFCIVWRKKADEDMAIASAALEFF